MIDLRDSREWPLGTKISRKDVHQFLHGTTPLNAAGSHDAMVDVQLLMEIIQHDRYPLDKLLRLSNAKDVAMTEQDIQQEMNVLQELEESQCNPPRRAQWAKKESLQYLILRIQARGGEIGGAGGAQAPPNIKMGGAQPPHFFTHSGCNIIDMVI